MTSSMHPNGGVGPKLWTGTGISGYTLIAVPANPVVMRFYRTLEGYSYTDPRCVVGMAPVSRNGNWNGLGNVGNAPGWYIHTAGDPTYPNRVDSNYCAVLIKRVNSTTWLELRWNALNNAKALAVNPTGTSPPFAFELWCSHQAGGALGTTRLATWDYSSVLPVTLINTPRDALTVPMYVEVTLLDNVVSWGLWDEYPGSLTSPSDLSSRIEFGSYAIPSPLQSVVGSSAGGKPGVSLLVDNPQGTHDGGVVPRWFWTANNVPFIHYMEFVDANFEGSSVEIPVIGDADDTPPSIVITGRIVDPVVAFQIPNGDGSYQSTRVILEGTIDDGDAVTIDLDAGGSITDSQGNNRYDMLKPGSRLPMLKPGINRATIAATDWDEMVSEASRPVSKHLSVNWRDALR